MKRTNKNFYFYCALPRSGSTLLSSILNNNSRHLNISANSILPFISQGLEDVKSSDVFLNFPYHKGLDNIAKNIFNLYYQDIDVPNILDNAPWGTPGNLEYVRKYFPNRKFVIVSRPILECLASFVKIEKPKNIEKRCDELMNKFYGRLGKNVWSISNLIEEKENFIKINYNDLTNNMEKTINKIYDFLEIEKEKFNLNSLNQFSFDGTVFDDSKIFGPLHTIRVDKIKKINYDINDYLPKHIIEKYKEITI